MVADRSLAYYGRPYHILIDPFLKASWKQVADVVPENSKVFEAGCGTGGLAFKLKKEKNCQVVGADLSLSMLAFAKKSNPYEDVIFRHMDISNIAEYEEDSFDYAVMCQVVHELPDDKRPRVISELMRIGRRTLILDSNTPLPWNILGVAIRATEATFGRDHYGNFRTYVALGGIMGILERANLTSNVRQRFVVRGNCQQVVILSR